MKSNPHVLDDTNHRGKNQRPLLSSMGRLLDFDLTRVSHWFKWACWLSLGVLIGCDRLWWRLPWEAWQSRMLYPGSAVVAFTLLFSLFNIALNRVPWTLFAALALGLQFVGAGEMNDINLLRKAAVMPWVYIVGLALLHDQARLRSKRRKPVELNSEVGDSPPAAGG